MTGKEILKETRRTFVIPVLKDMDLAKIMEQEIVVSPTAVDGFLIYFMHEGYPMSVQITDSYVWPFLHYNMTTRCGGHQGPILTTQSQRYTFLNILANLHDPQ